jgi:hypothetical protein
VSESEDENTLTISEQEISELRETLNGMILDALKEAGATGLTMSEVTAAVLAQKKQPRCLERFYLFGARLRESFGYWDACDPVAVAILNLVAAQNRIGSAIAAEGDYGKSDDLEPALEARRDAAQELNRALRKCPRAYQ